MESYVAFVGHSLAAEGGASDIIRAAKPIWDICGQTAVRIFDSEGRAVDFDMRGTLEQALERVAPAPVGPGRPRLGVTAREVTLLPRHWEWLSRQPGGASGTIRRLIDAARKDSEGRERIRDAKEATYRFISAMAGDLPGFEDASRALYAGDREAFVQHARVWPEDILMHALQMATPAFESSSDFTDSRV